MSKNKKVGALGDGEGTTENQLPWVPQSLTKGFSRWDDRQRNSVCLGYLPLSIQPSLPKKSLGRFWLFPPYKESHVSNRQRRNGAQLLHKVAIIVGIHPQSHREKRKSQLCPGIFILADSTLGYQNSASFHEVPLIWGVTFLHRIFYYFKQLYIWLPTDKNKWVMERKCRTKILSLKTWRSDVPWNSDFVDSRKVMQCI